MTILEDINNTLEANQALLTNLQTDQEALVVLVSALKAQVDAGSPITSDQLNELFAKVLSHQALLQQLNATQDQALEAGGAEPVPDGE